MIFCIYFPALLGFTFVFMLLLPNSEAFQLHIQSFVKTVAMMLGELEYQDTFLDLDEYINLFFFTFVVLISIIINNLLVGLTVDNVADLLKDAEFKSLESKITTISQIEKSYVLKKVSLLFRNRKVYSQEALFSDPRFHEAEFCVYTSGGVH